MGISYCSYGDSGDICFQKEQNQAYLVMNLGREKSQVSQVLLGSQDLDASSWV